MAKYTPGTQEIRTLKDYQVAQTRLSTHFVTKKMALAAKALVASGMTKGEVAKALDLPKDSDVYNLLGYLKRGGNA